MIRASNEQINSNQGLLGELPWKEVSTELRCDRDGLKVDKWRNCHMCQRRHKTFSQVVLLEHSIIGLGVSVIREGANTYVTGLDLLNADPERPNLILGYRLPGQSVTINLCGEKLIGFTVIVGEAGIHAIRPIFDENTTLTSWIGLTEGRGACKSMDLVLERDIKAISGKFDVSHLCPSGIYSIG